MSTLIEPVRRSRGRPPKTDIQIDEVRQRILNATKVVFAKMGYHGLTVELVLAEVNLSRPTFYRYFRSIEEPLDLVLTNMHQELANGLIRALLNAGPGENKLEAALLAWRDWGAAQGALIRPFYTEMHDIQSPVSRHRTKAIVAIAENLGILIESIGRIRPPAQELDILINCIEYIGLRYHLDTPGDPVAWKAARDIMMRVGFSLIASDKEWGRALSVMVELDVPLRPAAIRPATAVFAAV